MSDPSFVAASDQMTSAIRDFTKRAQELNTSLRAAGLTRRQIRRIIEAWITHLLTLEEKGR